MLLITESHDFAAGDHPTRDGPFTPSRCQLLLQELWEGRDVMLVALRHSPVPGLSTMLHIIRSNALEIPAITDAESIRPVFSRRES